MLFVSFMSIKIYIFEILNTLKIYELSFKSVEITLTYNFEDYISNIID